MATKKVADLLIEVLGDAGVHRKYGVSGDSLNCIADSIRATNATVAFAAGAEAHLPGLLAVCAGQIPSSEIGSRNF